MTMRTHAAPSVHTRAMNMAGPSPLVQSQSHSPHMSAYSQASSHPSHLSGATLVDHGSHASSATGLVGGSIGSMPHAAANGGLVMASDNIINQVADSSKSLYQICVKLRQRLSEVPGFEQHLDEMAYDDNADDAVDPVESMWRCLRKGYPLMTVYNALNPELPLTVDSNKVAEAKRAKTASFKFVQACLKDLNFPPDECFLIMDLYGDDTTGFVKVTTVVNRVLDILQQRNLLHRSRLPERVAAAEQGKVRSHKDYVVGELVDTERKYVQDLETLQQFKKLVEEKGEVAGDTIHSIFLNLNALLDFQRRFLIRIETMNSLPDEQQNWGQLFTQYHDAFRVYEPYIANQQNADEVAMREFDKLQRAGHRITSDRPTLSGFIMKPFQRLSKYPLLLKELRDKCDADEYLRADITTGIESAASVLQQANAAIDRQQRQLAVDELRGRVEEWKGHDIQQFGELLLYGTFTVVKGDGRNDVEREVGTAALHNASSSSSSSVARTHAPDPGRTPSSSDPPGIATPPSAALSDGPGASDATQDARSPITPAPDRSHTALGQAAPSAPAGPDAWDSALTGQAYPSRSPRPGFVSRDHFSDAIIARVRSHEEELRSLDDRKRSLKNLMGALTPIRTQAWTPSTGPPSRSQTEPATPTASRYAAARQGPPGPSRRSSREGTADRHGPQSPPQGLGPKSGLTTPTGLLATFNRLLDFRNIAAGPLAGNTLFLDHFGFDPRTGRTCLERAYANELGVDSLVTTQYKIYLFERILLCCKEQNPNKQKNKVMSMNKPALDKKGKPRLQLKGRIFMQNVTETLSLQKPGSYTIQIFWKGDPGVENFVIRFVNEETMKRWYNQVEEQRKFYTDKASSSRIGGGTSDTEFAWVKNQGVPMHNPYQQDDDDGDDDDGLLENGHYQPSSEFDMSRNASNTSLRSRSTTGDSGPPVNPNGGRAPPPRFPNGGFGNPPSLTLHTQLAGNAPSPGEHHGASYFSPAVDSPMSSRVSSSSGMYPFPRQATPNNGWPEEHNRFTAPAMGRTAMRPSLPAMAQQNPHHASLAQNRSRSASSPDIHNRLVAGHRASNGQGQAQPPVPDVPMPPFPTHMAYMKHPINRSQNNSPTNNGLPIRSATQSPGVQRERVPQHRYTQPHGHDRDRDRDRGQHDPRALLPSQNTTPVPVSAVDSRSQLPATNNSNGNGSGEPVPSPTQLKVKVTFDNNYVTLVVGMNISYQSLVDRIDAKLSRFTASSIGRGTIRLRYQDEDGDYVTIRSDEDIHIAFTDWKEQQRSQLMQGQLGEIQLYCQGLDN